jgi:pyruvate formate lyase activating enzyme
MIGEGKTGFCYIRYNEGGILKTRGWERSTGLTLDPIEKKPLYHVFPGRKILSLGTAGCNMGCKFCQNWEISKAHDDDTISRNYKTEDVVQRAYDLKRTAGNAGLAFTYNEPTIWAEWAHELAVTAKEYGLICVMVTNAYITKQAIKDLYPAIDASNIDLKSFTDNFYYKTTFSHLKPVLDAILWIKAEGTWIELTTLLIPGHNDSPAEITELCKWVKNYCGDETPLHFTAFHPDYKMMEVPATPSRTLQEAASLAKAAGLKYVYTGNLHIDGGEDTICSKCKKAIIRRDWFEVTGYDLDHEGKCMHCGNPLDGRFGKGPGHQGNFRMPIRIGS